MKCDQCGVFHGEDRCPVCNSSRRVSVPCVVKHVGKPGTELSALIPKFFESEECECKSYAAKMDNWGIDGCEKRFEEIVAYLVAKAKQKALLALLGPINELVARKWVRQAIDTAKAKQPKKPDNGSWFVAVTTAPRKDCTLSQCVQSIRAAGWEPTIFAEPGSTSTDAETIANDKRLGVWHNWLRSTRWAIENTNASYILTVQDDSSFHPDSRSFTESILWPASNTGFVSLYTPKHYTLYPNKTSRPVGINRITTSSLWGACAIAWPRVVLEQVVSHQIAKKWLGVRPKSGNKKVYETRKREPWRIANSDTAIGRIVNALGRSMWFVDPSPVSHIAQYSTISHGDNSGRRNCYRCSDHKIPLADQVPQRKRVELEI